MPVIWTGPGHRWNDEALAMPCSRCGAYIGKPCTTLYSAGVPREPHLDRRETAHVYGFRLVDGAASVESVPAARAEIPTPPQTDLFGGP